ncbi:hypothetical protein S40288_09600 [Stachybotrys chartarum IBT 40288]|nr:hypothetical protein S40288_09600 [Stachybotrys chartarum IBT 40288]
MFGRWSDPKLWPPMFNSMSEAYSLRRYWGKYWHMMLRRTTDAPGFFLQQEIPVLPPLCSVASGAKVVGPGVKKGGAHNTVILWDELRVQAMALTPPNDHVMPISNAFSAICGIFWSASYVLLTLCAFRDRSYGMPIFALCLNITCEFIYGFIYPPDPFNTIIFAGWAVIDVFLFIATLRYGKHEWRHAPMVANNLSVIIVCLGTPVAFWLQMAFASELIPVIGRQIVWWTRATGTLAANACFLYRSVEWPERFGYAAGPISFFYMAGATFIDIVYIITYYVVKNYESKVAEEAKKEAVGRKNGKGIRI